MARSTTLTLTAGEAALLFRTVRDALDYEFDKMPKGERRVANSVLAKCTAALIATQKPDAS